MSITLYYLLPSLHLLGAMLWAGGHLVLATTVLPRALRLNRASILTDFEQGYERVGLPVMAWHIAGVTVLSALFVFAGASARLGGFPFFQP